uniref:Uncharacterized protein n=1 Tax=Phaeocystis antarctica TaxID=33657 RepID=A0A7S0I5G4_9EUKA
MPEVVEITFLRPLRRNNNENVSPDSDRVEDLQPNDLGSSSSTPPAPPPQPGPVLREMNDSDVQARQQRLETSLREAVGIHNDFARNSEITNEQLWIAIKENAAGIKGNAAGINENAAGIKEANAGIDANAKGIKGAKAAIDAHAVVTNSMIVDGNTAVLVEVRRMLNYRDPPPLLPDDFWGSPHDEKKDNEPPPSPLLSPVPSLPSRPSHVSSHSYR